MVEPKEDEGSKKYNVLCDVLASAGPEGLERIAQDNEVYVDFDRLRARIRDRRDPNRVDLELVLRYLNECMDAHGIDDGIFEIDGGGRVTSKGPFEDEIYLTRDASDTCELRLSGKRVEFPEILKYSIAPLMSGLIDINYNGSLSNMGVEEATELSGQSELYNHQYIRVNNNIVFRVVQFLRANKRGTRFEVMMDREPCLKRVNWMPEGYRPSIRVPGFKTWDLEQQLAFESATGDTEFCFITGGSGSGKSVVAYAAAVEHILSSEIHERIRARDNVKDGIVLFKPNVLIGGKSGDLGFLPGNVLEKLRPFVGGFEDAHRLCGIMPSDLPFEEMLCDPGRVNKYGLEPRKKHQIGSMFLPPKDAAITIEHLPFARGRTFTNKIVFVDEAQNYSPHEISQLIERIGEGCKVFVVGDPEQVDPAGLDQEFNGLVYAAKRFYGVHPRVSFMHLRKCYRSQGAEIMRRHRAPRTL